MNRLQPSGRALSNIRTHSFLSGCLSSLSLPRSLLDLNPSSFSSSRDCVFDRIQSNQARSTCLVSNIRPHACFHIVVQRVVECGVYRCFRVVSSVARPIDDGYRPQAWACRARAPLTREYATEKNRLRGVLSEPAPPAPPPLPINDAVFKACEYCHHQIPRVCRRTRFAKTVAAEPYQE